MGKRIGSFLVEKGLITEAQIPLILKYSEEKGLRFGEAAVELKLFPVEKLIQLFGANYKQDFFNLDPSYFPPATKEVLSVETILKDGALLLGYKTEYKFFRKVKTLNVGLLDPSKNQALADVVKTAKSKLGDSSFDKTKVFLVLADQFVDVLHEVYGMDEKQIRAKTQANLDDTLVLYLDSFSMSVPRH